MQVSSAMVAVKEERPDESEIRELAEKMKEVHRAKMAAPITNTVTMRNVNTSGQTTLNGYVTVRNNTATNASTPQAKTLPDDKQAIDYDSTKGRFAWVTLGSVPIPYILRFGERYCAVRMVESKLLNKFLSYLHSDIYNYTNIRSYYITDAEARILNEINLRHCDSFYGRDHFTNKDLVVRLQDAAEFHNFLEVCYNKLNYHRINSSDRCGFIRINNESVVPYTLKDNVKYVPLFYFEGETDSLKLKAETLEGWDLAYLKFCCKVQGIRNELFASETCSVISLDDIKSYFPVNTLFDDYWPNKMTDCQLLSKNPVQNASWIRQPAGAPAATPAPATVKAPRTTSFPSNTTPPTAGTPGAAASLPPSAMPNWNSQLLHQQRLAAQALAGSRGWSNGNNSTNFYYSQLALQQQQQMAQKSHPPPLVRTAASNNPVLTHMQAEPARTYSMSKAMSMREMGRVMPAHSQQGRYNGYGTEVMDLSGQQQAHAQYGMSSNLVQIEELETSQHSHHLPYRLQKTVVGKNKLQLPCINADPYRHDEFLITVPDFIHNFFPKVGADFVQEILQNVLKVTLYRANRLQIEVLRQAGKCQTEMDAPALLKVTDVIQYIPQIDYVIKNKQLQCSEAPPKRMRIS